MTTVEVLRAIRERVEGAESDGTHFGLALPVVGGAQLWLFDETTKKQLLKSLDHAVEFADSMITLPQGAS